MSPSFNTAVVCTRSDPLILKHLNLHVSFVGAYFGFSERYKMERYKQPNCISKAQGGKAACPVSN